MSATFYVGDVLDVLAKLPENSVDLVLSSPPFLALRSYLPADHPLKEKEGGSQSTPGEYIDWLLDVVEACDRVLAPHGSLCFELGDTYSGSGGAGGDYGEQGLRNGEPKFDGSGRRNRPADVAAGILAPTRRPGPEGRDTIPGWPLAKSLSLIPESFRFAMVYGQNPFTGRQTERWRLRNVIRWVRPNPPVGALGDKFRPATSELMVFCKSAKRYFDLDAVRNPNSDMSASRASDKGRSTINPHHGWESHVTNDFIVPNPAGAPPLDWWNIPLLEDEEPTKGGPKERDRSKERWAGQVPHDIATGRDGGTGIQNALGAPPLDWWNIPPGGYEGAHYACVDESTEALTPDGWKSHKELEDGDLIAAYDPRTDLIKWETAKFVRYDVVDEPLVCIEKEQTSQRLTENHRMLVKSRKRPEPFVKLAGEVSSGYDLPLSAPWGEEGSVNGPGVVLASLLGWFITEGSARDYSRQAYIYQSMSANSEKVDRIRELLEWSGAPFDERIRDRSDEFPGKGVQVVFVVRESPLADWLRQHHKRLPLEYIFQWPAKDAWALFDAMIDGDGHRRADGRISFIQKDKDLADAFQCLAIRLGYRAVTKFRPSHNIYTVYVSENRWVTLRGTDGARKPIPRETYTGVVWCPQVNSTFWLARRNGKPFITGNTWPPELLIKPIKAMCPEFVCRTCGEARRRIVERETFWLETGLKTPGGGRGERMLGMPAVGHGNGVGSRVTAEAWSDCGHDNYRPGLVLDPFVGSGTTLAVASGHGRDSIGVDLDERNFDLALERVGPLVLQRGEVAA